MPSIEGDRMLSIHDTLEFLHVLRNRRRRRVVAAGEEHNLMPPALRLALISKACRGAIMFGDPISRTDAEKLFISLSKCKLPFICAHGRPSIIPLTNIL